jgi:hypothetical protein
MKINDEFLLKLKLKLQSFQNLGGSFKFNKWLSKNDNTQSLQFIIDVRNKKSIPELIILKAKEDYDKGIIIDENWFKKNNCNRGWCQVIVMNWLLSEY